MADWVDGKVSIPKSGKTLWRVVYRIGHPVGNRFRGHDEPWAGAVAQPSFGASLSMRRAGCMVVDRNTVRRAAVAGKDSCTERQPDAYPLHDPRRAAIP